jgi:hypothetical protein
MEEMITRRMGEEMLRNSRVRLPVVLVAAAVAILGGSSPALAQDGHACDHGSMGGMDGMEGCMCIHPVVDVKPGSYPNTINLKSKGLVPVALLGSNNFDVEGVKLETVGLHPKGDCSAAVKPVKEAFEDVNGNGIIDAVFFFKTQDLALTFTVEDTAACLHGNMVESGIHFCGHDSIAVKAP